ncbi:META domain-containing protein [Georgenia sp. SYP-B2076]|uniref:META domain-containing protein n=1 Tax=Georgenia sp. SYP-B2076 TaxID=2495881 RepID=UPI0013E05FEB|nr:META domain-containing protein [Georgenia sp. SYP-B2076]
MRRRSAAAAVVAGALLAACAAAAGGAAPDLAGKSFVSSGVRGHDLVAGTDVRLLFGQDTISVNAGCNTLTGAATWAGGVLAVDAHMAQTMMACSGELTDQDDWLKVLLTSDPAVALEGRTLTIGDDAEGLTLEQE